MSIARIKRLLLIGSCVVGILTPPGIVQADEHAEDAPWEFQFDFYGWLPDAPAKIKVDGKTVVDVPEELDTILESAEAISMFVFQAKKNRAVGFANVIYYKGSYDDDFIGPLTSLDREYKLKEEVTAIRYGGGYEFGPWTTETDKTWTLTPWVGGFWFHDDWSVEVKPREAPLGGKVSGTFEFNTPMLGVNSSVELSEDWSLFLSYGYGGWEVDDVNKIYDATAIAMYNFKMGDVATHSFFGYRYLDFDWRDDPVQLLLTVKGPLIGIGWKF